ncbi:MAG: ABC transporter permease [Zoogloeaceae bacterium]|jgi:putative ABC transport system permease protein|nr:ABC transporter permease [Zoogloeaceae bacterium]
MFLSAILLALREIRRNLMRSFLTTLGVVIGVAAVITMVTLGNGATRVITDQISSLGSNLLIMRPGQRMMGPGGGGGAPRFRVSDVEAIATQVSSLRAVAPTTTTGVTLVVGGENWTSTVNGTTNAFFTAGNWNLAAGRFFTEDEERLGLASCVIGNTVREKLFGGQNPLGAQMRVRKFNCEVVGVLASKGQGAMGQDQDDVVILPLPTVQRRLTGNRKDVPSIMISMQDGAETEYVMEQIRTLMRERRKLSDGDEDNFNILDTKQIAETLSSTIGTMTTLLGAVAAVSLLVGGIGIMNIMLVSVTERTREIGIRLAIGALEHEVLLQFLIEAVALSAFGGLSGIVLAIISCVILSGLMGMPFLFDPSINLLSFFFSALIGVLFGYMPARRAASLDPIEALRHE